MIQLNDKNVINFFSIHVLCIIIIIIQIFTHNYGKYFIIIAVLISYNKNSVKKTINSLNEIYPRIN